MTTAFGQTISAKLTFDATTGLATGVSASAKEAVVGGTIKHITSHFTGDEVVVGIGRTIGAALVAYAGAQFARKQLVGSFKLNAWSKEA